MYMYVKNLGWLDEICYFAHMLKRFWVSWWRGCGVWPGERASLYAGSAFPGAAFEVQKKKPGIRRVPVFATRCQILYPVYHVQKLYSESLSLTLDASTNIQSPNQSH